MNKPHILTMLLVSGVTLFGGITAKAYDTYEVKSGDTLSHISQQYNTSVASIVTSNRLANPNFILVGQKLTISDDTSNLATSQARSVSQSTKTVQAQSTTGWTTMTATAYDPQVAAGGATSIPVGTGVAANLSRFPKGTQLQIKYVDGHVENRVVNDTGLFACSNSNHLDISMANEQALQFGRQNVQVRVIN